MSAQYKAVAERRYDAWNARGLMRTGKSSRPTWRITMALATAAATSIAVMMTGVAGAETLPYDHYLCYPATDTHKQTAPPVVLIDQFDELEHRQENVQPTTADRMDSRRCLTQSSTSRGTRSSRSPGRKWSA
jgi:hypothetical protein